MQHSWNDLSQELINYLINSGREYSLCSEILL